MRAFATLSHVPTRTWKLTATDLLPALAVVAELLWHTCLAPMQKSTKKYCPVNPSFQSSMPDQLDNQNPEASGHTATSTMRNEMRSIVKHDCIALDPMKF